ncbi:MAG: glycosyltransferase family 2 protein [Prevotella sp.]|nr:glycosyltransferase family 2 protein [Prevotella sp.]
MSWYDKYLSVYGKPFADVPDSIIDESRTRIAAMQSGEPAVSVVVIAYNEATRLPACLWSLSELSTAWPLEIIGVDNNSSDDTGRVFEAFGVRCFREKRKSPGFARRCGLDNSRGKYHFFIDADTMYPPRYVDLMMERLERPGVSCVGTFWSFYPDGRHSRFSLAVFELIRDTFLFLQHFKRPELCVRGMTFAFRTGPAREVGIRTDIRRGEDGSLALGLKRFGRIDFLYDRKARVVTGYGTLNEDTIWQSLLKRIRIQSHALTGMFYKKEHYEDSDENLIHGK